jgi:hypothetical protein
MDGFYSLLQEGICQRESDNQDRDTGKFAAKKNFDLKFRLWSP